MAKTYAESVLVKYGTDGCVRCSHLEPLPIIKLAHPNKVSRLRIQHEFDMLKEMRRHSLPVPIFDDNPMLDDEGLFGYRIEQLFPIDFSNTQAISDDLKTLVNQVHESGFSHGDLNPSNVMRNSNGSLVLIDPSRGGPLGQEIPHYIPSYQYEGPVFSTTTDEKYLRSALAFYRIFFHPLAKYPGPLLAKVTDLNSTYHAVRGDRHLEFWRCHEKHGPVVRTGPNSLSFNSKAALKEIYGFKANVRKSDFYSAFPATKNAYSTHSAIDKSVHARKRRVLSQAFSDSAIKSMESHMLEHIRSFCSNLGLSSFSLGMEEKAQAWTEGKNLSKQADYLTFDIMGDLCFGKAFGMLERPDNRFATDLVSNAAHRHLICGTYLPIHEYHLDKILFRKIASGRARYMQYSKAQAAERTKMGMDAERKDFFYHLLNAKDPETGNGFSTAELWGESNLLIIAGSDTTSTAIAATFFYLTHYPEALKKLSEEVRSAFSDVEEIRQGPKLSGLQYLRACIDEAMRMSPSVGGVLPRQVLAGGFSVDGEHIPEDTVIGVPHYAIHHNPEYYPEPFTYRPERWIAGSSPSVSPEAVAVAQSAFCPFSVGPRGCIGKGMAYVEMTMTVARAVYLYDMRLAPGHNVGEGSPDLEYGRHRRSEFQLKDTFTSVKDGPVIEFRKCR